MIKKETFSYKKVAFDTFALPFQDPPHFGIYAISVVVAIISSILVVLIFNFSKGYWFHLTFLFSLLGSSFCVSYNREKTRVTVIRNKKQQEQQDHKREQNTIFNQANTMVAQSNILIKSLDSLVVDADKNLDRAEMEFNERVFAPFWDAVEKSINNLGWFDEAINEISTNAGKFHKLVAQLDGNRPEFLVSVSNAPNPITTSERMRQIVRRAQKDFEFATIYEQRKTNQILVAGFGSLARAIDNMTHELQNSISNLSNTIEITFENQNQVISDKLGKVRESIDGVNESIKSSNDRQEKYEDKDLEMQDNIQRRRKPITLVPDARDGNWEKNKNEK